MFCYISKCIKRLKYMINFLPKACLLFGLLLILSWKKYSSNMLNTVSAIIISQSPSDHPTWRLGDLRLSQVLVFIWALSGWVCALRVVCPLTTVTISSSFRTTAGWVALLIRIQLVYPVNLKIMFNKRISKLQYSYSKTLKRILCFLKTSHIVAFNINESPMENTHTSTGVPRNVNEVQLHWKLNWYHCLPPPS